MKPVEIRQDIRELADFVRSHFDPKGEAVSPYSGLTVSDADKRFDERGNLVEYLNAFERMEARFTSEFYYMDVHNVGYPNGNTVERRGRKCLYIGLNALKEDLMQREETVRYQLAEWHSDLLTTFDKLEELESAINKYVTFQIGKAQYQIEQLSTANVNASNLPESQVEPTEPNPDEAIQALHPKHELSGLTSYRQIALWHYYTWKTGEKQRPPVMQIWLKEVVVEMGMEAVSAWRQLRGHFNELRGTIDNPTSYNIADHEAIIPLLGGHPKAEKLAGHTLERLKQK